MKKLGLIQLKMMEKKVTSTRNTIKWFSSCADPEGATGGPDPPPTPEKSQNIGFLSNNGPDPPKNHKATKPAFNVGPSIWDNISCYRFYLPDYLP